MPDHFQLQFLITCNNRGTSSYLNITRDNVQGPLLSFLIQYMTTTEEHLPHTMQVTTVYQNFHFWCTAQTGSGSGLGMRLSNQPSDKHVFSNYVNVPSLVPRIFLGKRRWACVQGCGVPFSGV